MLELTGAPTHAANVEQVPLMAAEAVEQSSGRMVWRRRLICPEIARTVGDHPPATDGAELDQALRAGFIASDRDDVTATAERHGHWSIDHEDVICQLRWPDGTLPGVSLAVGVVVPLLSAALAGLIAWIVARQQRHSTREQWVLDKRYAIYQQIFETAAPVTSSLTPVDAAEAATSELWQAQMMRALMALELIAPDHVLDESKKAMGRMREAGAGTSLTLGNLTARLFGLVRLLRNDLVPKHMR